MTGPASSVQVYVLVQSLRVGRRESVSLLAFMGQGGFCGFGEFDVVGEFFRSRWLLWSW